MFVQEEKMRFMQERMMKEQEENMRKMQEMMLQQQEEAMQRIQQEASARQERQEATHLSDKVDQKQQEVQPGRQQRLDGFVGFGGDENSAEDASGGRKSSLLEDTAALLRADPMVTAIFVEFKLHFTEW